MIQALHVSFLVFLCSAAMQMLHGYDLRSLVVDFAAFKKNIKNINVNQRINGMPLLTYAIRNSQPPEKIRYLIEQGANVDLHTVKGDGSPAETPLCSAIDTVELTSLQLLLSSKADVNRACNLHYEKNRNEVSKSVNMSMIVSVKTYPLILAVNRGQLGTVKQLVAAGVDVNARDSLGNTAVERAFVDGEWQIFSYLIKVRPDAFRRYVDIPLATESWIMSKGHLTHIYPQSNRLSQEYTGSIRIWRGYDNKGYFMGQIYFRRGKLFWAKLFQLEKRQYAFCTFEKKHKRKPCKLFQEITVNNFIRN